MEKRSPCSIEYHFANVNDPRIVKKIDHKLIDVITIVICAVVCGADKWTEIELFGKSKSDWFETFLEPPNGIPSHDTFGRIFSLISPDEFEAAFLSWIQAVTCIAKGQIIVIDGKTLRHSYDKASNKSAIHMVSAWASENRITLGQVKTSEKSNEITAIPELLKLLDINGCIVTIDAMGCQKDIAEQIISQGGDYILALKENQKKLYQDVKLFFEDALERGVEDIPYAHCQTVDGDHGRIETRDYYLTSDIAWLQGQENWKGLKSIGMVISVRENGEKVSRESRFFICSTSGDVNRFAKGVRSHWGIENSVHWVLDVAFNEDDSRIRKGHAAENMSIVRHMALNMLRHEKAEKRGIEAKRKRAGWDNAYLLKVLGTC